MEESFRGGELTIAPTVATVPPPPRIQLRWSGRGSDREPRETLGPFLRGVVDRAAASGSGIELFCNELAYVNAATIGCIVETIHQCQSSKVPVTVRYDKSSRWQRLSFEAMRMMVKGVPGFSVEAS